MPIEFGNGRCFLPCRFEDGKRCKQVYYCDFPEKQTCRAVHTEIDYLLDQSLKKGIKVEEEIKEKLRSLTWKKNT